MSFNIIFSFLILFVSFEFAQASQGNQRIESFSKSKKILFKIHSKNPLTFYCKCKYSGKKPILESCGYIPKKKFVRSSRIEWEHILPASHFGIKFDEWKNGHKKCITNKGKRYKGRKCAERTSSQYRRMQSDLYNLQPSIGEINGLRSNHQIGFIHGENREFGKCDIEIKNKKIEPSEKIRGDIARTYMYMEQNYPNYIKYENSIKNLIIKWDNEDPVDDWECRRAEKIYRIQGNLNQILVKRCKKTKWDK